MIIGHGIDLEELAGFELCASDQGWLARCFRPGELDGIGQDVSRISSIAARFCLKEAVLKALGTGQGDGIAFTDVEVVSEGEGPPGIRLHDGAAKVAGGQGITAWQVSISHSANFAVASAIAVSG